MLLVEKIKKRLLRYFSRARWHNLVALMLVYGLSSWYFLWLANEEALVSRQDFVYWLIVTGSTVGYGDLSPSTEAGRWITSLYVIPVGLSIFALVLGRAAAIVSHQWSKGVKGMKPVHLSDHILVIGWNGQRTLHLLNMLLKEREETIHKPDVLLCVRAEIENPLPGKIDFVRVASFNKDEDMDRASVADAAVIIMDNPEDDLTMTTALYCNSRNPDGHLLAYFQDESLVKLLQAHCPNVECMPSVAVEMLAKSAFDPGSGSLHKDMLSVEDGQAQYAIDVPQDTHSLSAKCVFNGLKQHYDATFIGFALPQSTHVVLNPTLETSVPAGSRIHYIAKTRLMSLEWQKLAEA